MFEANEKSLVFLVMDCFGLTQSLKFRVCCFYCDGFDLHA
jgi:hypothetical protein